MMMGCGKGWLTTDYIIMLNCHLMVAYSIGLKYLGSKYIKTLGFLCFLGETLASHCRPLHRRWSRKAASSTGCPRLMDAWRTARSKAAPVPRESPSTSVGHSTRAPWPLAKYSRPTDASTFPTEERSTGTATTKYSSASPLTFERRKHKMSRRRLVFWLWYDNTKYVYCNWRVNDLSEDNCFARLNSLYSLVLRIQ